eukprot:5318790-Amphidinium_carterae.1
MDWLAVKVLRFRPTHDENKAELRDLRLVVPIRLTCVVTTPHLKRQEAHSSTIQYQPMSIIFA